MTPTSLVHDRDDCVERTAARFARATKQRWVFHYVRTKLRRDPATEAIARLAPLGDALDLGCGPGHLDVYLLERGLVRTVRAVDWDHEKIAFACRASEGLDATFETVDLRNATLADADTVLLVDVLHYVDPEQQDALIERAASLVRPGGRLVIRDATTGRGWRSLLTILVERISRFVKFHIAERISIRDVAREIVPRLEKCGLSCTVEPCWRGTPFSNVLVVATRPRTR